jgi:hypothetical protein
MIDRIPVPPVVAPAVRLHAWYRSASSLLRELSRSLNKGQTILRADSGLPAGTHLVLVMSADCLSAPLEVQGTVTAWTVRGTRHVMTLRYDFDPGPQRARLAEAMAELRRTTRRPRRTPRVPLELETESAVLPRGVAVSIVELSRGGARLRLSGARPPKLDAGSRLVLAIAGRRAGTRRPLRLTLEVRWTGPLRRSRGRAGREVGGRFVGLTPGAGQRLSAVLRFEEARPRLVLRAVEPPIRRTGRHPEPSSPRERSGTPARRRTPARSRRARRQGR